MTHNWLPEALAPLLIEPVYSHEMLNTRRKTFKKKECTVIIKKSVLVHLNLWRDGVPGTPTAFARAPRARREGIPLIISTENALCNETV